MIDNKRFFKNIKMKPKIDKEKIPKVNVTDFDADQEQKEIKKFEKDLEKELKDPKLYNELFGDLSKTESDKKVKSFVKVNLDKLAKSGLDIKIDKEKAKKQGVKFVKSFKPKKKKDKK